MDDYLTSSKKYVWRAQHAECTQEVKDNALELITKVNYFLKDTGFKKEVSVSSGFRPSEVNAKTKGASKKSGHMIGKSIDIEDTGRALALHVMGNLKALEKHGLYIEDPKVTTTWVHFQTHAPGSGKRVFKP